MVSRLGPRPFMVSGAYPTPRAVNASSRAKRSGSGSASAQLGEGRLGGDPLLVARGDPEDLNDLCLVSLGMRYVRGGGAAEPARALVVADEHARMALAVAVLDPDRLALRESMDRLAHR